MRSMKNRYLPTPSQVTQKMAESGPRSCCCNSTCRGSQISWDLRSSVEASGRALGWGYIGSSVLEAPCPRLITNEYGSYHLLSKPQFSSMYPPPPSQVTVLWQPPGTQPALEDQALAQWLCRGVTMSQELGVNCTRSGGKYDLQAQRSNSVFWCGPLSFQFHGCQSPRLQQPTHAFHGTSLGPSVPPGRDQQQWAP